MPVAGQCLASNLSRKLLISLNSLRWLLRRDARTGWTGFIDINVSTWTTAAHYRMLSGFDR